jgi:hypothetical protein
MLVESSKKLVIRDYKIIQVILLGESKKQLKKLPTSPDMMKEKSIVRPKQSTIYFQKMEPLLKTQFPIMFHYRQQSKMKSKLLKTKCNPSIPTEEMKTLKQTNLIQEQTNCLNLSMEEKQVSEHYLENQLGSKIIEEIELPNQPLYPEQLDLLINDKSEVIKNQEPSWRKPGFHSKFKRRPTNENTNN